MDPARLALIRSGDEQPRGVGSGYLIAPRLVLTARHVLEDRSNRTLWPTITVRIGHHSGGEMTRVPAQLLWAHSDGLDVALLCIDQEIDVPGSVRWGQPTGTVPLPYEGLGYPWAAKGETRDPEHLRGELPPLSGSTGRYVLDQGPAPVPRTDGKNAWGGASGAAIFCGGHLVGVVTQEERSFGARRLIALPVHSFAEDGDFVSHLVRHSGRPPELNTIGASQPEAGSISEHGLKKLLAPLLVDLSVNTGRARGLERDLGCEPSLADLVGAPRSGGELDKFGNRYEGAWTIRHALYVLLGQGTSLTLKPSVAGDGFQFVYRHGGGIEVHHVQHQTDNANSWNVASLRDKGIWRHLRDHVDAGRDFCFVSPVPARPLAELADRARRASDFAGFQAEGLTDELHGPFDGLAAPDIYGSPETTWRMLRGLWIEWLDERDVININAALAEQVVAGASGRLTALRLGDLLLKNLGTTLDAQALAALLAEYGLRRVSRVDGHVVTDAVSGATRRWAASVERDLLRPTIPREEVEQLVEQVTTGTKQLTLLTGAAGGGKSAVLHQAFIALEERDTPVLAFRLDRLEPFASTHEMGQRIGLPMSPVSALGAVAAGRPCVLIVDQLDAVSLASGRIPDTFEAVADLVGEAAAHPAMRIVLVCRAFDVQADPRIRQLTEPEQCALVSVGRLSDAQVDAAVSGMGLNVTQVTASQRALLRSPLSLVLLAHVAGEAEALSFRTTRQLFDAFWDAKRRDCTRRQPAMRFHEAVSAVVAAMSTRQQLSVPHSVLDANDLAASGDVLVSEHVCVRDGRQLAFFHESFFDYAFARDWLRRDETLVAFLTGGKQELFRRGQIRQVLDHLRDLEPERFAEEVEALLTSHEIRYHLKDVTLALLRGLEAPTVAEWEAVARVLDTRPSFQSHLVNAIGNAAWFRRADDEAVIENWLSSTDADERGWGLRMMVGAARTFPDRIARLLRPYTADPQYRSWLGRLVLFARVSESRPLFDLLIGGVRAGLFTGQEHGLWSSVGDLATEQPGWAVELLGALLTDRPEGLKLDDQGRVAILLSRDQTAVHIVAASAAGAPEDFCAWALSFLLEVMSTTANAPRDGWPVFDKHFAFRYPNDRPSTLGDALFQGAETAVRIVASRDHARARGLVEGLASAQYDAAQWLLYQALIGAGPALAPWSAEILLQGRHRLLCSFGANVVWGAREVLRAVGEVLPTVTLRRLEEALLHLRLPPNEELSPWHEFTLLSALPEKRLSERALRRLGELRRRHGDMREPDEPKGITGGFIGPPISSEAAQHMSDDQWLRAMKRHSHDRTEWSTLTGGAREQSHVLQSMTAAAPARFARLALRMDAEMHPAYGASLLRGLGDSEPQSDTETVFAAVRHLASQGKLEHDRWLGWALRKYLSCVPLDLVELLLDRVLDADDAGHVTGDDEGDVERDLLNAGLNTIRGSAAESLGDLLIRDANGTRAALVVPHLSRLAADSSLSVRACVAHLLHAATRHDRPAVVDAFTVLAMAPDQLLASPHVIRLVVALCHGNPMAGRPVMERMLHSSVAAVGRVGGQVAALAAMEWEMPDLLGEVLAGDDGEQRQGAADVCAQRLVNAGDAPLAHHALVRFFHDPRENVREAAATVAVALRGQRLGPFRPTLTGLIDSPAFQPALAQLLITLEHAPDRVDDLVLACVRRFIEVFGPASADLSTHAAADAHQIGELLVRAHVQAGAAARRSEILDLLDQLLLLGSYGVAEAIGHADRG
ncbi:serine protease [Streptomyces sp. NPDC026589]|uniref:serine protease n=1 Tax=Streptomyces sp. NPDC026589 TaxID=3155609 RepID=UPI0033C2EB23